jgi:hypothetical protein
MVVRIRAVCFAVLTLLASASLALGAGSSNFPSGATLGAQPDLVIGPNPPDGPGYVLAQHCAPEQPFITFLLRVTNVGSITSPAIADQTAVTATDTANPSWTAGASLGALSAGQTQGVTLQIPARAGVSGAIEFQIVVNGKPWFDDTSFSNNRMKITVQIPVGLCGPSKPVALTPIAGHVVPATPAPTPPPKINRLGAVGNLTLLSAPLNLQYTNNPKTCADHTGFFGGFICPPMLAAANSLTLVWDWPYCGSQDCRSVIDGYHIYKVSQGFNAGYHHVLASRNLVDSQSDAQLTIKGISPFKKTDCYVVTAYKGNIESPDSNWFCMQPQYGLGTESLTLTPQAGQTRSAFNVGCAHPTIYENVNISSFGVTAGRQGFVSNQCSGDQLFQGLFAFNLAAVRLPVQKATFTAQLSITPSCLQQIGLASDNWATANPKNPKRFQGIDPAWVLNLDVQGSTATADVTSMLNSQPHFVGDYKSGATLWEFVATGASANWGDQLPSCQVQIDGIQLQITRFK